MPPINPAALCLQMGRAGDNVVYQRAVEEVDQILRDGKMTEKQMRDLQKKFADTFTEPTAFGGTPSAGLTAQPSSGGLQPRPPDAPRPEGQGPTSQANRGPGAPSMPGTAGSPSKRRRHVDEWSVIVLQKDAEHLQKDRQDKQKLAAKKVDTRNELNEQIEVRRKAKEAFKVPLPLTQPGRVHTGAVTHLERRSELGTAPASQQSWESLLSPHISSHGTHRKAQKAFAPSPPRTHPAHLVPPHLSARHVAKFSILTST